MKRFLTTFIGLAGAAFLFIAPAQSATVSISLDTPGSDTGVIPATTIMGNVFEGATDSVGGLRRSPWQGTALEGIGTYTSVSADSVASYKLDTLANQIEFMWGSVDTYNSIYFFFEGGLVDFVLGQEALDANPSPTQGLSFGIATILANAYFDEVQFVSERNAFEYANLNISAVPLPAALPLYGAGLAVMGFVGWRKRRKAAATA